MLIGQINESSNNIGVFFIKDEYDFSPSAKNLYIKKLKKQVTIWFEEEVIEYFKVLAEERGISSQSLIHLYLLARLLKILAKAAIIMGA
ncbi:MAG: hypothetical protein WBG73_00355 [Coleofasciculaceae cyanobacterium]